MVSKLDSIHAATKDSFDHSKKSQNRPIGHMGKILNGFSSIIKNNNENLETVVSSIFYHWRHSLTLDIIEQNEEVVGNKMYTLE